MAFLYIPILTSLVHLYISSSLFRSVLLICRIVCHGCHQFSTTNVMLMTIVAIVIIACQASLTSQGMQSSYIDIDTQSTQFRQNEAFMFKIFMSKLMKNTQPCIRISIDQGTSCRKVDLLSGTMIVPANLKWAILLPLLSNPQFT